MIWFFWANSIEAVLESFEVGLLIKGVRCVETARWYLTELHILLDFKYIFNRLILSHLMFRCLKKHCLLLNPLLHITLNLIGHFILASNRAFHVDQSYIPTRNTTLALIFILLNSLWISSIIQLLDLFIFIWLLYLLFGLCQRFLVLLFALARL